MKDLSKKEELQINGGRPPESEWELYNALHNDNYRLYVRGESIGELAGNFAGWVFNGVTRFLKWR